MAARFWVGGSGTWDSSSTTHWASTSGGAGGASVPGSADTVTFDANSGSGNYTVTVSSPSAVNTITMANPTGGVVTLSLSSNLSTTGTSNSFTLTTGTITLNNNSISTDKFLSNNSNTRTINWGTSGAINCTGSTVSGSYFTVVQVLNTGLTYTGTPNYQVTTNAAAGHRIITFLGTNTNSIPNITVTQGSDIVQIYSCTLTDGASPAVGTTSAATIGNVTFQSGFTGSTASASDPSGFFPYNSAGSNITVVGDVNVTSNTKAFQLAYAPSPGFTTTIFAPTSGTSNINIACPVFFTNTNNAIQLNPASGATVNINWSSATATTNNIVVNGPGTVTLTALNLSGSFTHTAGTVSLAGNITHTYSTTANTGGWVFTAGTLNLNTYTLTVASFLSTGTSTRTISFGSGGAVNCTIVSASGQIWTPIYLNSTNLTYTGTPNFNLTGNSTAGTRLITITGTPTSGAPNFTISSGSDAVQVTNASYYPQGSGGSTATLGAATIGNITCTSGYTGTSFQVLPYSAAGTITFLGNFSTTQTTGTCNLSYQANTIFAPTSGSVSITAPCAVGSAGAGTLQLNPSSGATITVNLSSASASTLAATMGGAGTVSITNWKTSAAFTLNNSSGTVTITSFTTTSTFTHTAGTLTLNGNFTYPNAYTLTAGTINLNNNILSCTTFSSSNTNTRTISFGTTGSITVTSNGTVWNTTTLTNMTILGNAVVNVTNSTTTATTISPGPSTESQAISFNFTASPATTALSVTSGHSVKNLTFTGSSGTWANNAITIYGNLTVSSGLTVTSGANTVTFASSLTGKTITSNGKSLAFPITFSGTGGWILQDALNVGANTITHTSGTFSTGGFAVTATSYTTSGTSAKVINLGSSTVTLTGTGATLPWNLTGSNYTLNAGTSTIVCSGAAPTFNGNSLTYYNLSFSNASATAITMNGANTFNNATFSSTVLASLTIASANTYNGNFTLTALTSAAYTPVSFGGNQMISGTFSISGSTTGNCRYFIKSSVLDTQRTLSAGTVTNLSDIDFRDIIASGAGSWSGTRIGDAGNNSGITFTTPVSVTWAGSASNGGNWSASTWTSSRGTNSATAFPLPQDSISTGSGASTFTMTLDFDFNIGSWTFNGGGISCASGRNVYLMGNTDVTIVSAGGFGGSTFGNIIFYNRAASTKTLSVKTLAVGTIYQWPFPTYINTNGTLQLTNCSYNSSATINNQFQMRTSVSPVFVHQLGTLQLQNNTIYCYTYDSSYSGNTRTLDMGSGGLNISYGTDSTAGFVVKTSGYTLTSGTSTLTMAGASGAIISDGNLTFNNISFTTMNNLVPKLIGNSTYINNSSTQSPITITANNFTTAQTGANNGLNSVILFSGISNLTITGTLTLGGVAASGTAATRQMLMSLDTPVTVTAPAISSLTDIDFSGIIAAGDSAPWSGTRLGNAGRNSGITFPAAKTVYWSNSSSGNIYWYNSLNWAATSGGATSTANFPLPQDTAIFTDSFIGSLPTFWIGLNFCMPILDFSATTKSFTISGIGGGTMTPIAASLTLKSNITMSAGTTWCFVGDSTQIVNTAGRTWVDQIKIISGSSVQLGAALTSTSASGVQLVAGDLNLNNFTLTTPLLAAINPTTKSLTFGSSGSVAINGNAATVLSIPSAAGTNFTTSGTSSISLTYASSTGTRTVDTSGIDTTAKSMNISVTAGSDIISFGTTTAGAGVKNLTTQGFTGTWVHQSALNLFGNLTVGTGVTTIQDVSINYVGTGASTLTSNGKTLRGRLVVNSNGGSLTLADNLTLTQFSGGQTSYLQLTQGTFDAGGKNITLDKLLATGTTTRSLSMGTGTWTITSTDDTNIVWDMSTTTNLTVVPSTSTITLSGAGTKTFNGGSKTFNNLSVGGSGTLNVLGSNTFNTFSNTTQPMTVLFQGSNSQSFTTFSLSGTSGNLVTVGSTTAIQATLYKATAWNVGTGSVDGGGNTGLSFTSGSNNFLSLSNINGTNTTPLPPALRLSGCSLSGGYTIAV